MGRAESVVGREQLRGRGLLAGIVDAVAGLFRQIGAALLGSRGAARDDASAEEWWKEDYSAEPEAPARAPVAHQARLFDDDGGLSGDLRPTAGGAAVLAPGMEQGAVVELSGSRVRGRGIAVTRAPARTHEATSAAALEASRAAAGALARQLCRSHSISSGIEEPRWFTVPPRGVLLPRYQLFDSADAVVQDKRTGRMTVRTHGMRVIHGRIWFV